MGIIQSPSNCAYAYEVLSTANRRIDIAARVLSTHPKFKVAFEKDKAENVAHGGRATFKLTATISAADIAATPELYNEPSGSTTRTP